MSGTLPNFSSLKVWGSVSGRMFNGSGSAGPRRLVILSVASLAVLALVVIATTTTSASTASDATVRITSRRGPAVPEALSIHPERKPGTFGVAKLRRAPDITMDP